ncbi:MAG: acylphosphatase [Planctomycetaceae bacterium]|nr:MAG: acylphosphatase [Planctomycetaceae bacterium]
MSSEQRIVNFSGVVQGVGFRYTACREASRHDVTGYVRNLPDSSVECVVEGSPAEIDAFIAELSQAMAYYIRKVTQQTAPASGQFHTFGVEY